MSKLTAQQIADRWIMGVQAAAEKYALAMKPQMKWINRARKKRAPKQRLKIHRE